MPEGRTETYAIYRACERFGILPPDVKTDWESNSRDVKANLLAYSQIRDVEHQEEVLASIRNA